MEALPGVVEEFADGVLKEMSAAGALDEGVHQRCTTLLQQEARQPLPRAGYDAVDDSIRAVSLSLLEVVTPSFSP